MNVFLYGNLDTLAESSVLDRALRNAASDAAFTLREIAISLGDGKDPTINFERLNVALSNIAKRDIVVK